MQKSGNDYQRKNNGNNRATKREHAFAGIRLADAGGNCHWNTAVDVS